MYRDLMWTVCSFNNSVSHNVVAGEMLLFQDFASAEMD